MKKKIGFVLNGPIRYSETFLLQEFQLLKDAGFDIILFEGYSRENPHHDFKTIKALPTGIKGWKEIYHVFTLFLRLFVKGFFPLIKFIYSELTSGTGIIRMLKRVWFNAHILPARINYLHFCFADVAIQKELTAKALGAKMSVSLRGSDILVYPKKKDCYNRLWEQTDKIHAVSKWILGKAIELGLDKKKTHAIIHDGIDPNQIPYSTGDLHSPLRILNIGRLEQVKDHNFALNVIHELIKHKILLTYSIIGEGSEKPFLLSRIKELNIERHVELKGKLSHEKVLEELSTYDVYIHTSRSEGFSVSLLEAQAAGLLTISLASGSTGENIEDTLSGWIINGRSPAMMAQKIIEIIALPVSERMKVKNYSRKRIEQHFNIKKYSIQWKAFFEN